LGKLLVWGRALPLWIDGKKKKLKKMGEGDNPKTRKN